MKKKILSFLAGTLICGMLASSFASCVVLGMEQGSNSSNSNSSSGEQHRYLSDKDVVVLPTCTEQGYTIRTCADCGYVLVDEYVPAFGHSFKYVSNKDATCMSDGTKTGQCEREGCEEIDVREDEGSKLPHSVKKYTSNGDGTETGTCTVCEEEVTRREGADEEVHTHSYTQVVTAPTCTEQGYTTYTCSCTHSYKDTYVEALNHDFQTYVLDNNATCTEDGTETAQCEREGCNGEDTRTVADSALGHDFQTYVLDNNATCTEDGTETAQCEREGCNEADERTVADSALGHDFQNYVSNGDATYESDGTKTAQCEREGCEETDTIQDEGSKKKREISFKTLTVNGTEVSGEVSSVVQTFSFDEEINLPEGVSFVLSTDEEGLQICEENTVSLVKGENIFYVHEKVDGETRTTYTVTLTRKEGYTVSFNTNGGSEVADQTVDEGACASEPTTTKLGCTATWNYDFTQPVTTNITIEAIWTAKAEMSNFTFTSTATTCAITGVQDKTVQKIVVPDYVTAISEGAFAGCSSLTEITLPFIGAEAGKTAEDPYQYPFGYIFGQTAYEGATQTEQYYYGENRNPVTDTYYIPTTLNFVKVTGGEILYGAFSNCTGLTNIVLPKNVTYIGANAFKDCRALSTIVIPATVTCIGASAFAGCESLIICCEVSSLPSGWSEFWNDWSRPVIWDCYHNGVEGDGYLYTDWY